MSFWLSPDSSPVWFAEIFVRWSITSVFAHGSGGSDVAMGGGSVAMGGGDVAMASGDATGDGGGVDGVGCSSRAVISPDLRRRRYVFEDVLTYLFVKGFRTN